MITEDEQIKSVTDETAEITVNEEATETVVAGSSETTDQQGAGQTVTDKEAELIKDLMKWKGKARETEERFKSLDAELSKINSALNGATLEDLQNMVSEKKDSERKQLEAKGEYDRIVQQMREENSSSLSEKESVISDLNGKVESLFQKINKLTIGRAFSDSDFLRNNSAIPVSIAAKEFGDHFDFVDGKVVAFDKPKHSGERTPLVDANGDFKSFEAAIEQLYAKHPDAKSLIRSKRKPGAGSNTASNGGVKPEPVKTYGLGRIRAGLSSTE